MKYIFKCRVEWSEWSEHSPQHQGQLPHAVVFPDGERVGLDVATLQEAQWQHHEARRRKNAYVQIHEHVRFRESHWGDDGRRRMGRAGSKLEIMAPANSTFLFTRRCPWCGGVAGEQSLPGERYEEEAEALYHSGCEAELEAEEAAIEADYLAAEAEAEAEQKQLREECEAGYEDYLNARAADLGQVRAHGEDAHFTTGY